MHVYTVYGHTCKYRRVGTYVCIQRHTCVYIRVYTDVYIEMCRRGKSSQPKQKTSQKHILSWEHTFSNCKRTHSIWAGTAKIRKSQKCEDNRGAQPQAAVHTRASKCPRASRLSQVSICRSLFSICRSLFSFIGLYTLVPPNVLARLASHRSLSSMCRSLWVSLLPLWVNSSLLSVNVLRRLPHTGVLFLKTQFSKRKTVTTWVYWQETSRNP